MSKAIWGKQLSNAVRTWCYEEESLEVLWSLSRTFLQLKRRVICVVQDNSVELKYKGSEKWKRKYYSICLWQRCVTDIDMQTKEYWISEDTFSLDAVVETFLLVMVGKNDSCNSSEGVKSGLNIGAARSSGDVDSLDYSPTFPYAWENFQNFSRLDSRRNNKHYSVGCLPLSDLAEKSHCPSTEEIAPNRAYLTDLRCVPLEPDGVDLPKRKRFSSGYLLGLFMRRQNIQHVPQMRGVRSPGVKRQKHKENSVPKSERHAIGIQCTIMFAYFNCKYNLSKYLLS